VSGCFVSVLSEDREERIFRGVSWCGIYAFFPRVTCFFFPSSCQKPSFKTRGLRELRTLVRLVLTGPSDKGGG